MSVVGSQTPTVSVQVPVPTPVQQPKRPPVQFRQPTPQPQQVGPSGVPAVQPPQPQMTALVLPWAGGVDKTPTTGKQQLQRRRFVVKLSRVSLSRRKFTVT